VRARPVIVSAVGAIHIGLILWMAHPMLKCAIADTSQEPITLISVLHFDKPPVPDMVPIPEVQLKKIEFEAEIPMHIVFGDPDWDAVPGITGIVSTPHPVGSGERTMRSFAKMAGLAAGDIATVVLGVEVLADGSVGEVSVIISSGNGAADVAAVGYVESMRWTPGSRDHHATEMKIRWPVTLIAS
jgi:TonB family protein